MSVRRRIGTAVVSFVGRGCYRRVLAGLDSSGGVIIVVDAGRFERAENGEHVGVVGDT